MKRGHRRDGETVIRIPESPETALSGGGRPHLAGYSRLALGLTEEHPNFPLGNGPIVLTWYGPSATKLMGTEGAQCCHKPLWLSTYVLV